MKDISIYFSPVDAGITVKEDSLGGAMRIHSEGDFPAIDDAGIAVIYVPEFRNSEEVHTKTNESFR